MKTATIMVEVTMEEAINAVRILSITSNPQDLSKMDVIRLRAYADQIEAALTENTVSNDDQANIPPRREDETDAA